MKANLSRQITLLGFGAMAFYGSLLATGQVSIEILPQFAVSAVFFLFSGKIMRQMASQLPARQKEESEKPKVDWAFRTTVLNWVSASVVISVMVLILAKPADMTYRDLLKWSTGDDNYPVMTIP